MYVRFDIKTLFLRLPASDCTFVYICQMFGGNMKVSFLAETSRCLQVFKRLPLELLWAPRLQNFSAILRIKMDFDEKTRSIQVNLAVWLFLSVLSYIYIYYRDQTWSNKVIHIHHSTLHCCCATPCIALPQLYSLAPYELSLKHHEAPYSWNWFPWLRRRLLPFWPLFSCGPHVQIRTAGRTKPVVLKDGVLSESTWVYVSLPSSTMST